MNIVEILKEKKSIFLVDEIESKKMQTLVESVNSNIEEMLNQLKEFKNYKNSQLNGEMHRRIVMAKSLLEKYPDWQAVVVAHQNVANEEKVQEGVFYSAKSKLLTSLQNLLNETKKSPLVCNYDMFGDDYQACEEGHEIIIMGSHNIGIIENMIKIFDNALNAKGLFEDIGSVELQVNNVTVTQNAELCYNNFDSSSVKANKLNKIRPVIEEMVEVGKEVVIFETYKKCLADIGVKDKDIQTMEKNLIKKYIPLKKYLQKEFAVKFADICDLVVDEDVYAIFEVK